jgi:hypothetical protein
VNVADRPPVEVVVEGLSVTAVLPNFAVTALEPSIPVAVIVTVEPTLPEVGLKLMAEVTVNVAVGEFVPSVSWTVWLPEVADGTVNVADKPPVEVVVEVLNVTAVPAKVALTECEPSMPVAVIVTVEPTVPEVGLRLIADVTVYVAVGEFVPSLS